MQRYKKYSEYANLGGIFLLFSEESGYLDKGKGGREKEGLKKERRPDDLRTEQSPELKYEGAMYDVRRIYEGKEEGRAGNLLP